MTLLAIVQLCMGSKRSNGDTLKWKQGHCTIGTLLASSGISNVSPHLRIGVGDGQSDVKDWALFMLQNGNANRDFAGDKAYAFGSEGRANTGHVGMVNIYGEEATVKHLFS